MELPRDNLVREQLLKYHSCLQDHMDEFLARGYCALLVLRVKKINSEAELQRFQQVVQENVTWQVGHLCSLVSGSQLAHGEGSREGHSE